MVKLGDKMVIKDINVPDKNFKLLIEEQLIGNKKYRISSSYAPSLDIMETRISISIIDDTKINDYQKDYGISLSNGDIRSYYIALDKNNSSHECYFTENKLEYYNAIIEEFNKLIKSGKCEFTKKALDIFEHISSFKTMSSGGKNAI